MAWPTSRMTTSRTYQNDVAECLGFVGLRHPAELRTVTRGHVIAWPGKLAPDAGVVEAGWLRGLCALSSVFDYL